MSQMKVFCSMWSMEFSRPDGFQWPLEEKLKKIAEAGFAGVSFDIPHHRREFVEQAQPLLKAHGLELIFNAFVDSSETYQDMTRWADTLHIRPLFFGLVGQVQPWDIDTVARQTRQWLDIGATAGFPTYVEVHRNCMTNDLHFTLKLMDKLPDLYLVGDFSHALLNQEWYLPLNEDATSMMDRCLSRTHAFHGRVGTREQAQVALSFPQNQEWFDQFKSWWRQGFQLWQQRHPEDKGENCIFLCELGPPPYAITDANGQELSDRWQESLLLKETAERLWDEALILNKHYDNRSATL